jgi:hypothetical protein
VPSDGATIFETESIYNPTTKDSIPARTTGSRRDAGPLFMAATPLLSRSDID